MTNGKKREKTRQSRFTLVKETGKKRTMRTNPELMSAQENSGSHGEKRTVLPLRRFGKLIERTSPSAKKNGDVMYLFFISFPFYLGRDFHLHFSHNLLRRGGAPKKREVF